MNMQSLIERFIEAQKLNVIRGSLCPDIFLPYLLMDCQYQIFSEGIRNKELKGYSKVIRNRWTKLNTIFFENLFKGLNAEDCEALTDIMDEFEEYIKQDAFMLKNHVMNCMPNNVDFEKRMMIGDSMTCNILAQCAQIVWGSIFKTKNANDDCNPQIQGVVLLSHRMACEVHNCDKQTIDLNNAQNIRDCVEALKRKMIQFLRDKDPVEVKK